MLIINFAINFTGNSLKLFFLKFFLESVEIFVFWWRFVAEEIIVSGDGCDIVLENELFWFLQFLVLALSGGD